MPAGLSDEWRDARPYFDEEDCYDHRARLVPDRAHWCTNKRSSSISRGSASRSAGTSQASETLEPRHSPGAHMHMTSPTSSDVLSRARALIPALRAREDATTAARDVPPETIEDFRRAGLLRLLQPRRFGGHQASVGLFLQTVEILAEGCAASAWAYGVLAELEWVIACFPERAQLDIWSDDQEALAAACIVPRGVGVPSTGGWRVTGRYGFASACRHAKWLILGVRCQDPDGTEVPRYLAVPTHDAEILDDWHALGMRGTGSFGVALHDVFVPEHRSVPIADIGAGTVPGRLVHPDYAVIRAPRYYLVPFVLPAVGFGIANRALATVPTALRARGQPASDARICGLAKPPR